MGSSPLTVMMIMTSWWWSMPIPCITMYHQGVDRKPVNASLPGCTSKYAFFFTFCLDVECIHAHPLGENSILNLLFWSVYLLLFRVNSRHEGEKSRLVSQQAGWKYLTFSTTLQSLTLGRQITGTYHKILSTPTRKFTASPMSASLRLLMAALWV